MNRIEADAFPLTWPREQTRTNNNSRSPSRFKITFAKARDKLFAELKRMSASHIVLSTNIPLRNDGLPYANFKEPEDPGVAVYFLYKGKSMVFACDHWKKTAENINAIMLTIQALRGIARWGSGDMLEKAFTGFQALPSPDDVGAVSNIQYTRTWKDIFNIPSYVTDKKQIIERVRSERNSLIKLYHSDVGTNPNHSKMVEINTAYDEAKVALDF